MRHFLWACLLWPCCAWAEPSYAERVLTLVNGYRESQGLPPLQPAPALERIALPHSLAMAAAGRASHGSFIERFERSGSELCVENIAAGRGRPEQVLAGWRNSPAHDRNLLEPRVRWVGVVSVEGYTTLFACASDGAAP